MAACQGAAEEALGLLCDGGFAEEAISGCEMLIFCDGPNLETKGLFEPAPGQPRKRPFPRKVFINLGKVYQKGRKKGPRIE